MKTSDKFLRSKVAHRVVLLFISCALLPVTILAVVSYFEVSQQLRELSQKELSQATRRQGMEVYERLELLDSDLQVLAADVREHRALKSSRIAQNHYSGIALFSSDGKQRDGWGNGVSLPELSSAQKNHLRSGGPLLNVVHSPDGTDRALLLRMADTQTGELLAGEPESQYLFAPLSLSPELKLCVLSAYRSVLYCSDEEMNAQIATATPAGHASGQYQWKNADTSYDAAYWKLLTKPIFLEDSWTIAVSKDHAAALAPINRFSRIFPLVVLLSLWIVLLSSLIQIRRTLGPLEQLREGTQKIGMRQFEHRVQVNSGDEFEGLAHSLNLMSAQLGRQFHALRTVNEIDQAIFASLDRETIIDGVLQRMPRLFPADAFGVCILEETKVAGSLRLRFVKTGEFKTTSLKLATTDWLQLQRGGRSFTLGADEGLPSYLEPLRQLGMNSCVLLPIRVENTIQAVLLCANESHRAPAVEDLQEVEQVADQLAVAFSHVHLIQALEDLHIGTLKALARAIDAKSQWTAGHSERVTNLALEIGREMGLSQKDLHIMEMGGLLHDIGKIGTPPNILDKPDKLTPDEMRVMRDHVRCGVRILEPIRSFRDALPIVAQHHEWFNGMGYPEGLAGQQISLYARIFAVADCYDALKSDRPYRSGMTKEATVALLRSGSGTQFDPAVIEHLDRKMQKEDRQAMAARAGEAR